MSSVITFCAWCPTLRVLQLPERPGDYLALILKDGRIDEAWWLKAYPLADGKVHVSEGICEECRAQHFPNTVRKGENQHA